MRLWIWAAGLRVAALLPPDAEHRERLLKLSQELRSLDDLRPSD
jgi:hypothetical protein